MFLAFISLNEYPCCCVLVCVWFVVVLLALSRSTHTVHTSIKADIVQGQGFMFPGLTQWLYKSQVIGLTSSYKPCPSINVLWIMIWFIWSCSRRSERGRVQEVNKLLTTASRSLTGATCRRQRRSTFSRCCVCFCPGKVLFVPNAAC